MSTEIESESESIFSFNERLGIYHTVQASCLSAAAVLILLTYAFARWWKRRGHKRFDSDASGSSLFLNLMLADLIQAMGSMPSIRWMLDGYVAPGTLCTAQAVLKQIGINGVALSSLFIAFHTFAVFMGLRIRRAPKHASKLAVLFIWAFVGLVVGIPYAVNRGEDYYGPAGHWCWIVDQQKVARIVSEYLWVWSAALIMAILYGILFLVMRGFLLVEAGGKISWAGGSRHGRRERVDLADADTEEEREARATANLLLFYPAVYIISVFPNSLSRWLSFSGTRVPAAYTLFAASLFAFSGLFNVVLYFVTRPEYAVGPSTALEPVGSTLPTTNEHDREKYESSPSEVYGPEHVQLDVRYHNGHVVRQEQGRVLSGSVPHQSPPTRIVPLSGGAGANGGGLLPPHGQNQTGFSRNGRGQSYDDDDDDDQGMLPN